MPDQDPTSVFSRPKVPQRGNLTMQQAGVDFGGQMDPEMAETLHQMRGAVGAASPAQAMMQGTLPGAPQRMSTSAWSQLMDQVSKLFGNKAKAK